MRHIVPYCVLMTVLTVGGCQVKAIGEQAKSEQTEPAITRTARATTSDNEDRSYDNVTTTCQNIKLDQAIRLGLNADPRLKAFDWHLASAISREEQAGLSPELELEFEVENFAGSGESHGFYAAEGSLVITKTLETGKKADKRTTLARIEKELAQTDRLLAAQDKASQMANAFIDIAIAQLNSELASENLSLAMQIADNTDKLHKSGLVIQNDVLRSQIELNQARKSHLLEQGRLKSSKDHFQALCSGYWLDEITVDGQTDIIAPLPDWPEIESRALASGRYKYIIDQTRKEMATAELEKAQSNSDITIGAGVQFFNENDDKAAIVSVSVPLASKSNRKAIIKQSLNNMAIAREEEKAAKLDFRNELKQAYNELAISREQVLILQEQIIPSVEKIFDNVSKLHLSGKIDMLALLEAKRSMFEAKADYIECLEQYHKARITIMQMTGEILVEHNSSEEIEDNNAK
ncbi:MAG: TolC family protein [Sedimentisphaerales bacterium]|nr:TolC family protein [Sedimentisphaerales bacterium]MBN2842839.1 TolC family protein [Sedimentisphaerales bacterium]